jgi:PAS domain-containing protein
MTIFSLLLELTWSDIPDAVKYIGGTAGALVAVAGGYKAVRGNVIRPLLTRRKAKNMEKARVEALFTTVERIESSMNMLVAEVRPNGGSSIKDSINRIDVRVEHLHARVRHQDETNPTPTFQLDDQGECTFANTALCELLRADESDLFFAQWYSFVDPTDRAMVMNQVKEAVAYKFPIDITARFRTEGDRVFIVRLKASPHIVSGGVLRGFFGTACAVKQAGEND